MILCSGCFDGIHAGHVRYLKAAQQLRSETSEPLMVAVAPDSYIRTKHGRDAYWPQAQRAEAVRALAGVSGVYEHAEESIAGMVRTHRPRLLIKGVDWARVLPEDVREACEASDTVIVYVETNALHTSEARG